MANSPSLLELKIRIADHREALESLHEIGSLHEGPFDQWRNWEFWAQLARRWRERAPKERTREQAREHYRRVVRALGIRRSQ